MKMIRSVLSVSEDKLSLLDSAPCPSAHDRNILKDLIEILTPFEEATDFVQVSCVPSAGYVLPCVKGLLHHTNNCSTKYHSSFVQGLKASLLARMTYYETNDSYILAAMLDPCFKLRWCKTSIDKVRYQDMLKDEAKKYDAGKNHTEHHPPLEPPPKKPKVLFDFMAEPEPTHGCSNVEDIDRYLSSPCQPMETDPAKFWKENENEYGQSLLRMAKEILSIPSSSAPVERLFSIAGKVFTPSRCRLQDSRFEQLMFIRCNNSIIN